MDRHRGQDKAYKYEAEVKSLRTDMAVLSQELLALRANSAVRPNADVIFVTKCHKAAKERDEVRTLLAESEKQLGLVRRQIMALKIRGSALETGKFILKSDHAMIFKKRQEELLADMNTELIKGHV